MNFVHLHNHSHFSVDSIQTPEQLCRRAKELGQTAVALTDHGTMSGSMDFYNEAKIAKIKPIFGLEAYYDFYQNPNENKLFHITLLAKNKIGFQNLIKIDNLAHENIIQKNTGVYPTATIENIYNNRDGIIVLTGCPVSVLMDVEDEQIAMEYVGMLHRIFQDDCYIEMMLGSYKPEHNLHRCRLAQSRFGIPFVLSQDSHFTYKYQEVIHPFSNIAKKGYNYNSEGLYITSVEEVIANSAKYLELEELTKIIETTNSVAEKVECFSIEEEAKLPKIPENGEKELYDYLSERLEEEYRENFEFEWKVFKDMGFMDYLYILYDIKKFAEERGIFVRCRGSAGGSYLIYLLGISPVHPVKYGLFFDRFLNYARRDAPDVDIDVDPFRRDEIFAYVLERWGMRPVSTFIEYSHKSAIHDIVRVLKKTKDLELPFGLENEVCEGDEYSDKFKELCGYHELIKPFYDSIVGTYKTRSKHAAAVGSAVNACPIECWNGEKTLAYSESGSGDKFLQEAGITKFDILAVSTLTLNSMCAKRSGVKFTLDLLTPKVFELFEKGNLNGIFQFKSGASIKLARDIKPGNVEDVSAIVALNRPSCLDSGLAWTYATYKQNPRKIHPLIDELLTSTYGVIIYQEDVMSIFSTVTNEGAEGRNDARKYLVPKSFKLLDDPKFIAAKEKLRVRFMTKGLENGYTSELLEKIWHEMDTFGRYGFNKAHSMIYAFNALESAYYKVMFPEIFFWAAMSIEKGNKDGREKIQEFCFEAAQQGIKLKTPHILHSGVNFELKDVIIYFPLYAVSGIGEATAEKIVDYRNTHNITKLSDIKKIPSKLLNVNARANLFHLNGFDGLEHDEPLNFNEDRLAEFAGLSKTAIQMKTLGFILPNNRLLNTIASIEDPEVEVAGYVTSIKSGETKTGKPKRIVKLYPFGYFSIMDFNLPIQEGDFVYAVLNKYKMPEYIIFADKRKKYQNNWGRMEEVEL